MNKNGAVVAGATIILALCGCKGDSSSPYTSTPQNTNTTSPNTVTMSGVSFNPRTLTVNKGTTVTWKNADNYNHTATSDSLTWDTGNIIGGASKVFTFNNAGTYPYHCVYHSTMGMRGTIVVQ